MPKSPLNSLFSSQSISLLICLVCVVVLLCSPSFSVYGLSSSTSSVTVPGCSVPGCSVPGHTWPGLPSRLTFHFLHASILHLIINLWSLLSLTFFYRISVFRLFLAFIIASLLPSGLIPGIPIVGLSGIIYALIGLIFFQVYDKRWIILSLGILSVFGIVIGTVAVTLHIWSFFVGLIISIFTSDILED